MSPDPASPDAPPKRGRAAVIVYRSIGAAAVGLAAAGVVLPLLPTTVFLLIALWAFSRGAPELADRLRADRRFGPFIRDWEARGAIPRRAKVLALVLMASSWTGLWLASRSLILCGVVGAVLLAVSGYIVTRPSA